jgi:hypothetical protein
VHAYWRLTPSTDRLTRETGERWQRWAPYYGALNAAWVPSFWLTRDQCAAWLDPADPVSGFLEVSPAYSLQA